MAYIDLNPVRVGMVREAKDYPWSSHSHYIGQRDDKFVIPHSLFWILCKRLLRVRQPRLTLCAPVSRPRGKVPDAFCSERMGAGRRSFRGWRVTWRLRFNLPFHRFLDQIGFYPKQHERKKLLI